MRKIISGMITAAAGLVSVSAAAENGLGYTQFLTCASAEGTVRFDNYSGYGHGDGYRSRVQVVALGGFVTLLREAGLFPSKESSQEGEFIIDHLERDSPLSSNGSMSFGTYLEREGYRVDLNRSSGEVLVRRAGTVVRLAGLECRG